MLASIMSLERIRHNHAPTPSIHKLKINRNTHTSTLVTLRRPSRHRVEGKGTSARARCWARGSQPTFPRWLTGKLACWCLLQKCRLSPGSPFSPFSCLPWFHFESLDPHPKGPLIRRPQTANPASKTRGFRAALRLLELCIWRGRGTIAEGSHGGRECAGKCMKTCKTNKLDFARSHDKVAIRQRQIWQHLPADGWLNTLVCPGLPWFLKWKTCWTEKPSSWAS